MKRSPAPTHPIRGWRKEHGVSPQRFEKLVKKNGGKLTHRSLGEIELGRRRPSYELAKVIVKISHDELTVDQILTWKRSEHEWGAA